MLKFLLVVILIAVMVYLTVRVIQRRGILPPSHHTPPPRPLGPDDDPDFLRKLDERVKRRDDPPTV